MKRGKYFLYFIFLLAIFIISIKVAFAEPIIINHTSIKEFDSIPDYYIDKIKSDRLIVQYIGQSHGRQMLYGLQLLENIDPKYSFQNASNPSSYLDENSLRLLDGKYTPYGWSWGANHDSYWSNENARLTTENTTIQANSLGFPINISLWAWSYHICSPAYFGEVFSEENLTTYLNAISRFNNNPDLKTTYVYHTSVSDCSTSIPDSPWLLTYYDNIIKQTALANNKTLFDQADIENWNINNTEQRVYVDYAGRTTYLRHTDYNEGASGVGPDTYPSDHTNDALEIRKAKAMWVLMAKLEGWNSSISGAPACDLTSTSWNTNPVVEGENISINIFGTNCGLSSFNISVYENDLLFDDLVDSFISSSLNPSWIAKYVDDGLGGGDPEYYFVVNVLENESESVNNLLSVSQKPVIICNDADLDNYNVSASECGLADCNDSDNTINPNAIEVCDGIDNNCNLQIDENVRTTYYQDSDADGYGSAPLMACTLPDGYAAISGDCNDNNNLVNPSVNETCSDGIDNNCNGIIDGISEGCSIGVSNGLVLYYTFDEVSGSTVKDSSGSGLNGTLVGDATIAPGKFGNAYHGTGNNDKLSKVAIPLSQILNMTTKTITFWAKMDDLKSYNMIYENSMSKYVGINAIRTMVIGYTNSSGGSRLEPQIPNAGCSVGEWCFYAIAYNLTGMELNITLYRNGTIFKSYKKSEGLIEAPIMSIGDRVSARGNAFNGTIDDFRIYNRVLTTSEVQQTYNNS